MNESLTEFMDAEFLVTGAETPVDESRLLAALVEVSGIVDTKISQGRVDVHYDPIAVSKKEVRQRIEGAGFRIKEEEAAAASPLTDAELPL